MLVSLYGPKRDEPEFYNTLKEKIMELDNPNVIMAGDWNMVLDTFKDYQNYKHVNNPKAREVVESMITDLKLCDIWRDLNPDCQRYTWRRTAPFQQARLDFFLVTDSIVSLAEDSDINCGYRTDHSMLLLKFKFSEKTAHKTFWKLNTSLLKDKQYLDEINKLIDNIIVEYAVFPYARDSIINIPKDEIQFLVSDDTRLDFLLMKIRSKTIAYATMKKKRVNKKRN